MKFLNSRGCDTSQMRWNVRCRLGRHCSGCTTTSTCTRVGGGGAVGVHSRSGGAKRNCIELCGVAVAENHSPVVLDDIVTIVDPQSGPKSCAYKISGARAPTNRARGRNGSRADEFLLVFVPKLHGASNVSKAGEHEKAAMWRKYDSVSTSSTKVKNRARLTIEEERFGWHVPENHDEFTAIQCDKKIRPNNRTTLHLPLGSQAQSYTGLSTPASIEAVPAVFIKNISLPP